MKHIIRNRVGLIIAMCVACVLACGSVFAWASDSGLGGPNTLVVNVANPESEIKDAVNVQVQVYQIATGAKDPNYDTYNFSFGVPAFAQLQKEYDLAKMSQDDWQKLAVSAQKVAAENAIAPSKVIAPGEELTGLQDGLYLVALPNAQSSTRTFTFTPAIVALPGKMDANRTTIYNTVGGDMVNYSTDQYIWTNTTTPATPVTIYAKWSMEPRYGSLFINKTVEGFTGDPVTFTYAIEGFDGENKVYENRAAVHCTSEGVESNPIGHIPAGLTVRVTEIDTGVGYELVSENDQTAVIVADDTVSVSFTNTKTEPGDGTMGYGIENHYVFVEEEDGSGGEWQLVEVREVDKTTEAPNGQN